MKFEESFGDPAREFCISELFQSFLPQVTYGWDIQVTLIEP